MLDRLFLAISAKLPLLDGTTRTTGTTGLDPSDTAGSLASSILSKVAGVAGVIIAIILIISIVKAVLNYAKGSGSVSIFSIIGRVIFLGICIGLIVLAVNWNTGIGKIGQNIAQQGANLVEGVAGELQVSAGGGAGGAGGAGGG